MDLAGEKKLLRARIGALRDAMTAQEHADASGAICERLWQLCCGMAHAGAGAATGSERVLGTVAGSEKALWSGAFSPFEPSPTASSFSSSLSAESSFAVDSAPNLTAVVPKGVPASELPHSFALAAYMPHRSEADIAPLIERCWRTGMPVALPKAERRERWLRFYYARGAADLAVGAYGIREPLPTLPEATAADLAVLGVLLVPGLAFDESLWRLGYGGGYYDRLLARLAAPWAGATHDGDPAPISGESAVPGSDVSLAPAPDASPALAVSAPCRRPLLVAAAFELQIVDAIPTEPHDIPLDAIVTEKRVILRRG
jgi:5-formyltetrahydrofolate cyclo-ligase